MLPDSENRSEIKRKEIEKYLSALRPEIQVVVLRELELAELRGQEHDFGPLYSRVMDGLRRSIRMAGLKRERVGNPSRLFFMPLEPYLVDGAPAQATPATVPRRCLQPIWAWLCRELMPDEAQKYIDTCTKALLAENRAAGMLSATVFQERFVERALTRPESNVARRLMDYGAPPTAPADFRAVLTVMQMRDRLSDIGKQLPGSTIDKIADLEDAQAGQARAALQQLEDQSLAYGIALMMARLAVPWQVARAVRGDDRLENIAKLVAFGRMQALLSHRDMCERESHEDEAERIAARVLEAANAIDAEFEPRPDEPGAELFQFARGARNRPTTVRHPQPACAQHVREFAT